MTDLRSSLITGLSSLAGEAEEPDRWSPLEGSLGATKQPSRAQNAFLADGERSGFPGAEYTRAGVSGGLNDSRNMRSERVADAVPEWREDSAAYAIHRRQS
jgi:hypothetical protein